MNANTLSANPTQSSIETMPAMAVGRYLLPDGSHKALPYSINEFDRADQAYQQRIGTCHFRTGAQVLIISLFDESYHLGPLNHALNPFGLVMLCCDASYFDAARTESSLRRFNVSAIVGINNEVLNGLEEQGHDVEKLLQTRVVWARPDAYQRLSGMSGFKLLRWMELGPATAMECAAGAGAHLDRLEWDVDTVDDELVLTSKLSRSVHFDRYHTGLRGTVERTTCACGNADPRITLL